MTTATMTKTDAQIKTDVLAELKWDRNVDETDVGVQVHDGVVTLVGNVKSYAKKVAARDAAHRVFGVLDVADDLVVKVGPQPCLPNCLPDVDLNCTVDIDDLVRVITSWGNCP